MAHKEKNKKRGKRGFIAFLLTVVIVSLSYITLVKPYIFERETNNQTSPISFLTITPGSSDDKSTPVSLSPESEPAVSISPAALNSPNAILINLTDHTILLQKNSEEKIYPASLTKMMTALVAIENLPDLKEKIKLTNATFEGLYEAEASRAGFEPGEQVRAIDLLYGVLLPSGAECCVALADQIAGSEQNFVKLMNQKATDLGMKNTHFENTTGLHNENHYTTVKDLAVLLSCALQNDTFREIFTAPRHSIQPTNKHPDGITFYSTTFKELNDQSITNGEILGGKTGYTKEAGQCLASLAKVGKQEYILVSAGAKGDQHQAYYNISDALAVYNSIEIDKYY